MRGLIQKELGSLKKVNVFTPNMHEQWMKEENERSFIEWCRKEQAVETRPDTLTYPKVELFKSLTAFLP